MIDYYVSFGQAHKHEINGILIDKDCLFKIKANNYSEAREKAFELFKDKWCFIYGEWNVDLRYFPRGIIEC